MTRLHPLSALVDVGQRAVQFGSFGLFAGILLSVTLGVVDSQAALVLAPLGAIVGAGYGLARYLRFEYELAPEHLIVTSGVFARQEREIPLHRVQNVDVSRSLLQRALGLATVRFETAGGSATEAELDAVSAADAERLRHEVGERVRAVRGDERPAAVGDVEPTDSAAESRGEILYEISTDDLLVLSVVSFRPRAIAAPVFGAPFAGDIVAEGGLRAFRFFGGGRAGGAPDALALLFTAITAVLAFALTAWVASAALTFARYYDFTLERAADELRYERGLIGRYSGTVPLEKVQTVSVAENVAMRWLGYASLSVETAGYAPGSNRAGGAETTLPLASRSRVFDLARDLQPFDEPTFERPPPRARRRYAVRYALVSLTLAAVLYWLGRTLGPVPTLVALVPLAGLPLAPVAARAKWRHRGYDEQGSTVLTRSGFWHRSTRVVPYYRLQTVFVRRTVFQRRWGLASLTVDTASTSTLIGGDATAHDVDESEADGLRERLLARLRENLLERRAAARARRRRARSANESNDDSTAFDDSSGTFDGSSESFDAVEGGPRESDSDDRADG